MEQVAALVVSARDGDGAAMQALVRMHLRPAYALALAIVGRPADAEDVAQDAVLAACLRLDTCREPSRFRAWLFQIVRNRAHNWLAARRLRDVPREGELSDAASREPTFPPPDATRRELRSRLVAALRTLTLRQREVVLLHDLEGWTHVEIAAALELSEVGSRQHLFMARRQLRALLAEVACG